MKDKYMKDLKAYELKTEDRPEYLTWKKTHPKGTVKEFDGYLQCISMFDYEQIIFDVKAEYGFDVDYRTALGVVMRLGRGHINPDVFEREWNDYDDHPME